MTVLNVVSENTGAIMGTITRSPDGTITGTGLGDATFAEIKRRRQWTDDGQAFENLARDGASNGYTSVKLADNGAADQPAAEE